MATPKELAEAKAFQYKTATLDMLLNKEEGFDPVNDGFHRDIFKYALPVAKRYNEVMMQHNGNPLGSEYQSKTGDQFTMLTPDASEPGRFRLSYFDKQGFSSHNVYDTIPQAVEEMVRGGYYTEAKGILSKLSQSPEFEIGNRVSTLIGQFNMGKLSHQEFSDQRQAIHDDVQQRMAGNSPEKDKTGIVGENKAPNTAATAIQPPQTTLDPLEPALKSTDDNTASQLTGHLKSLNEKGANINQLLATIVQHEQTPLLSSVATLLQNKNLSASIEFNKAIKPEDYYLGLFDYGPPPKISLNPECGELLSQVLLHECIHAAINDAIESGDKASNLYLKRLNEIKQHARKELIQKGIDPEKYYGLSRESHVEELITETFTDPVLRQVLQQVSSKAARGTKLPNTIKTMYDEIVQIVNNIIGGEEKHHPVIKELMEIGAGLMIVNNKYTGGTMNMIINDRGESVAAVGNEISIARAKVRWPNLIEETQALFIKYPHDLETMLINQIAAQDIRNIYEAQAVLDAATLPVIESNHIYKDRKRIVIDPEKYSAMFTPTEFNVGDPVTYTNPQGVVFEDKTIFGVEKRYGEETKYFYTPTDTPWYSVREHGLQKTITLDLDASKDKIIMDNSILNTTQDAEYIVPIYAKTDRFFQTVKGSGNAPDKLTLSDEGKEHVYGFVLQSRMPFKADYIKALETLYAHGDKGVWIRDIPPKQYELLNNISGRQLDEGRFDVNQKMLAHALSGEMDKWNDLKDKHYLVKSMSPEDTNYSGYPALCITKSGTELVETAHIISEKIIEEHKRILTAVKGETIMAHDFKDHTASENGEFISETREKLFPHDSKPLLPNQEAFMVMLCFDGRHDLAYQNLHNWSLGIESTHESFLSQKGNDDFIKFTYDMSNYEATNRDQFKDLEAAIINKNELTDIQAGAYKEIMQAERYHVGNYCKTQWLTNQYVDVTAFNHTDTDIIEKAIESGNNEVDRILEERKIYDKNIEEFKYPVSMDEETKTKYFTFVTTIQKIYPLMNQNNIDKLCQLSIDMSNDSMDYIDDGISYTDYQIRFDKNEAAMNQILKDMPGTEFVVSANNKEPFATLVLPDHPKNVYQNENCYIPEIPIIKLQQDKGVTISPGTDLLSNLKQLFPEVASQLNKEQTIDLVPPNGKDFYEQLTMRAIEDTDILPPNSYTIKHYTASPATGSMTSDSEHIKHEFTFNIKDNKIEPYWMQDGALYHDTLSNKSNANYVLSPDKIKQEMDIFVSDMLNRIKTKDIHLSDAELTEATKQARKEEYSLTDIYLEDKSTEKEKNSVLAMMNTNRFVDEAIARGLLHAPFDDFQAPIPALRTTQEMIDYHSNQATYHQEAADKLNWTNASSKEYKTFSMHTDKAAEHSMKADEMEGRLPEAIPSMWDEKGQLVIAVEKQLYKFQIKGYEKSSPETYMLGLGSIDSKNQFTGTLKHEQSIRDLTNEADYNTKSGSLNYDNYFRYSYANFNNNTVEVSSLPITNVTLVNNKENTQPDFPALSPTEQKELSNFTNTIQVIYRDAKTENLHKLCTIASDMQKYTIQNTNGSLSAEKFNALTDHQEKQIQELIKDLPGIKINLPYEPTSAAITIDIPAQPGCLKSITCNVPEIPKNKLTIAPVPTKTATEIVSNKR